MTEPEFSSDKPQPRRNTLRKSAKLRHRTLVQSLFEKGKSVYSGPLRVTYRALSAEDLAASFREEIPDMIGPVQVMVTIPKKKRRHAVDRVLLRRRVREAFRLQCHDLRTLAEESPSIRTISVAIVYMKTENAGMEEISSALTSALGKIIRKLTPQPSDDENC